jgi:hypothetical protein
MKRTRLTLRTAQERHQDERTAMQQTVQRAMNTYVTHRIQLRKPRTGASLCRDALHVL